MTEGNKGKGKNVREEKGEEMKNKVRAKRGLGTNNQGNREIIRGKQ